MIDLVVIGGGSAGYVGAIRAAQLGKKVVLIEQDKLGGTCLHRGCIPTKTLLHTAELVGAQNKFDKLGLSGTISYDQQRMNDYKNEVVNGLAQGISSLLDANQIEVIQGEAIIEDEHSVRVNDEVLKTNYILIASGAKTKIIENTYSSDDVLDFGDKKFSNLVIIGGGVIGCEFAQLYQSLGVKVTILEAEDRILNAFDKEISQNQTMIFKQKNTDVFTSVRHIEILGNEIKFKYKDFVKKVKYDGVIAAIGRQANQIESLIEIDFDHSYVVNEFGQTSVENIYAVGDCASPIQLAHFAQAHATVAVETMFTGVSHIHLEHCPSVVYTNPEIASVGLTLAQASEKYEFIKVGKYTMSGHGYTMIRNSGRSFVKLVVDYDQKILVGAQLMCQNAGDIIQILVSFIKEQTPVHKLREIIYPHPSFAEAIVEAVNALDEQAIHVIPKKSR